MDCVNSVKIVLKNLSGVMQLEVSLDPPLPTVQYNSTNISVNLLKAAIIDAGFEVTDE